MSENNVLDVVIGMTLDAMDLANAKEYKNLLSDIDNLQNKISSIDVSRTLENITKGVNTFRDSRLLDALDDMRSTTEKGTAHITKIGEKVEEVGEQTEKSLDDIIKNMDANTKEILDRLRVIHERLYGIQIPSSTKYGMMLNAMAWKNAPSVEGWKTRLADKMDPDDIHKVALLLGTDEKNIESSMLNLQQNEMFNALGFYASTGNADKFNEINFLAEKLFKGKFMLTDFRQFLKKIQVHSEHEYLAAGLGVKHGDFEELYSDENLYMSLQQTGLRQIRRKDDWYLNTLEPMMNELGLKQHSFGQSKVDELMRYKFLTQEKKGARLSDEKIKEFLEGEFEQTDWSTWMMGKQLLPDEVTDYILKQYGKKMNEWVVENWEGIVTTRTPDLFGISTGDDAAKESVEKYMTTGKYKDEVKPFISRFLQSVAEKSHHYMYEAFFSDILHTLDEMEEGLSKGEYGMAVKLGSSENPAQDMRFVLKNRMLRLFHQDMGSLEKEKDVIINNMFDEFSKVMTNMMGTDENLKPNIEDIQANIEQIKNYIVSGGTKAQKDD